MTDKEQIIIENYFNIINDDTGRTIGIQEISDPRELIKAIREQNEQLARKTQECEELENKIKKLRKNLALEIEANDRYRKALEEIEQYINEEELNILPHVIIGIKNIINKAKGEENVK